MRKLYLIFIVSFSLIKIAFCQNNTLVLRTISYKCHGNTDSIRLPIDFVGPKYFNYEEGSIIYFDFFDSSKILILCGGNATITPDSTYVIVDSSMFKNRVYTYKYFSPSKNLYSRQDFLSNYDILYQDVSIERLKAFDESFDYLKNRKENK